jgi:hypothetical protein
MTIHAAMIDCDGHILEPPDLWEKDLEPAFGWVSWYFDLVAGQGVQHAFATPIIPATTSRGSGRWSRP